MTVQMRGFRKNTKLGRAELYSTTVPHFDIHKTREWKDLQEASCELGPQMYRLKVLPAGKA